MAGAEQDAELSVMEKREEFPGRAGPWEEAGRREWS